MRLIILSIVFFMMIGSASASMRTDSAKICGVIYKYDSKYVYLKTKSGRKTIAPIEKFSKNQLKSQMLRRHTIEKKSD